MIRYSCPGSNFSVFSVVVPGHHLVVDPDALNQHRGARRAEGRVRSHALTH